MVFPVNRKEHVMRVYLQSPLGRLPLVLLAAVVLAPPAADAADFIFSLPATPKGTYLMEREIAGEKHLRNQELYARTFWAKRSLWEQEQAKRRRPVPSLAQITQWNRERAPMPTAADFRSSGRIHWPIGIASSGALSECASRLDELLSEAACEPCATEAVARSVHEITGQMLGELAGNIRSYHPQEYVRCKGVVQRLHNWSMKPRPLSALGE
jgi:hypothetical protein